MRIDHRQGTIRGGGERAEIGRSLGISRGLRMAYEQGDEKEENAPPKPLLLPYVSPAMTANPLERELSSGPVERVAGKSEERAKAKEGVRAGGKGEKVRFVSKQRGKAAGGNGERGKGCNRP
jgi:hypothetical protein